MSLFYYEKQVLLPHGKSKYIILALAIHLYKCSSSDAKQHNTLE